MPLPAAGVRRDDPDLLHAGTAHAAPAARPGRNDMADISGIAHIQLTVTDMARSVPFYRRLLLGLGMVVVKVGELRSGRGAARGATRAAVI